MKSRAAFKSPTSNAFHQPPPSDPAPFLPRRRKRPTASTELPKGTMGKEREPESGRGRGSVGSQQTGGMRLQRDQQHMFRGPPPTNPNPPSFLKVAYKRLAAQEVGVAGLKPSAELQVHKSIFCHSSPKLYVCPPRGSGEAEAPLPVPIRKKQQQEDRLQPGSERHAFTRPPMCLCVCVCVHNQTRHTDTHTRTCPECWWGRRC